MVAMDVNFLIQCLQNQLSVLQQNMNAAVQVGNIALIPGIQSDIDTTTATLAQLKTLSQ